MRARSVKNYSKLVRLVEKIEHSTEESSSQLIQLNSNEGRHQTGETVKRRCKYTIALIVFILLNLNLCWSSSAFSLNGSESGGRERELESNQVTNEPTKQPATTSTSEAPPPPPSSTSPASASTVEQSSQEANIIQADNFKVQNQNSDPSSASSSAPATIVAVLDSGESNGAEITNQPSNATTTNHHQNSVISSGESLANTVGLKVYESGTKSETASGDHDETLPHDNQAANVERPETTPFSSSGRNVSRTTRPPQADATPTVSATNTAAQPIGELEQQQRRRAELEDKLPFTVANGAADQDNSRAELETVSQRASRLLLQLLVLGFFILLSTSLIVVYSIKFCVCQRRKERRLLRRALIGDVTSSRGPPDHLQHQLLTLRNLRHQSQPIGQVADQHECACLHWRHLQPFAQSPDQDGEHQHHHHHHHNHDQLDQLIPRLVDNTSSGPLYLQGSTTSTNSNSLSPCAQPQLVLALLERLQQLIGAETPARTSSLRPLQAAANSNNQQLSQLIVAQLQTELSPLTVPFVGQPSCACQLGHLERPQTILASVSARPPAYSELFLISNGDHHHQGGNACGDQELACQVFETSQQQRQNQTETSTGDDNDEDDAEIASQTTSQ